MTKEHEKYLDELQESGKTNMFWASPFLQAKFGLDRKEAKKILRSWMNLPKFKVI